MPHDFQLLSLALRSGGTPGIVPAGLSGFSDLFAETEDTVFQFPDIAVAGEQRCAEAVRRASGAL